MRRIYFAVFGSGLGHASRIQAIAKNLLNEQDEYLYSSFDEALDYFKKQEVAVVKSPSVDLKWNEAGGFSARDSFVRFPYLSIDFARQVSFELGELSTFNPNLVVSDTRLSTVFAARLKSLPLITILNQFKILFPPKFRDRRLTRFYERVAGDVLGLFWSLSDEVLIPDLPPPFTISEANVTGVDVANKARFIGFMSPSLDVSQANIEKARRILEIDSRPFVFIQISGPNPTKKNFIDIAMKSSDVLSKKYNVAISLGYPGSSNEPRRLANGAWLFDWCPYKDELFALSDLLVVRSGHMTISQCVNYGKPAILVPIHNHSEQIANADKFQQLGLGIEIRSEHLTSEELVKSVDLCLTDQSYIKNLDRIRSVSRNYNGTERAVEVISSYL